MRSKLRWLWSLFALGAFAVRATEVGSITADPSIGASAHVGPGAVAGVLDGKAGEEECRFAEPALVSKTGIGDQSLNYFVSTEGNRVYYITGTGNKMGQIGSDKVVKIPGRVDPVPTPDGKWLTVPTWPREPFKMQFFNMNKLKAMGDDASGATPDFEDGSLSGVYQSIGMLPEKNGNSVYRVITDKNGASFQDYEVREERTPVRSEATRLCPELEKRNMKMPMLSKDGRYISLFNTDLGVTKIYEIQEGSWACKEVIDLGIPTGKVDFSFNNARIAFHVDSYARHDKYFSGVDANMTKDIYSVGLNRDAQGRITGARDITRLSFSGRKGSGTYYPRWNSAGHVVAARDEDNQFSLAEFDPTKGYNMPFWTPRSSQPATADAVARYALGALWNRSCAKAGYAFDTVTEAAFATLSLDPESCRNLARKYWAASREEIVAQLRRVQGLQGPILEEVNEAAVLAACPDAPRAAGGAVATSGSLLASRATPAAIFSGRCQDCHTGSYQDPQTNLMAPAIDFDKPLTQAQVLNIRARIGLPAELSVHMPPPGSGQLTDDEQVVLRDFLDARERELR